MHLACIAFLLPDKLGSNQVLLTPYPARVLRLLAANYIFVEKKPGVFANNRCSIGLDTGKSVKELQR